MILYLILLILVALVVERWSIRHALDGVKYELKISKNLVEIDEEFQLITTLRNASRRFIPFIRISEYVPRDITMDAKRCTMGFDENRAKVNSTVYMMPRQKMVRRLRASLGRRGRYVFNGAILYGGDFLGLSEKAKYFDRLREAVVLPKRLDSVEFDRTLGGFLGDVSVNRFILEDPVLTLGFRDYTGREPMKQISFTATARTGRMMVKQFDHTLDVTVSVVLNLDARLPSGMARPLMETCFSMTRGVCEMLEEKRIQYAFCTNARAAGQTGPWEFVSDGLGGAHLSTILEGLGRAACQATRSRDTLLDDVRRRAESGRAHIILTPGREDISPAQVRALSNYTGAKVLVVSAEEVTVP